MMNRFGTILVAFTFTGTGMAAAPAGTCRDLPDHVQLTKALETIAADGNGGLFTPNAMWATLVSRDGTVCVVTKVGDAWPGSRVISAQKANTGNAFSNHKLALSTANLFSAVQPGGSLFGLQESNPVSTADAYHGASSQWGTPKDALVGKRVGGVNVFGGGLPLYRKGSSAVLGGIGVSGDTSCSDHIIAWRLRASLGLDAVVGGVSPNGDDNIIFDIAENGKSASGFGHPVCSPKATELGRALKAAKVK